MQRAEFESLVHRLTAEAERSPGLYRAKVLALTLFGYGTLILAALLALLCSIGMLALMVLKPVLLKLIKFAWIPLVFAWFVLKSMFVRIAPPEGRRITRAEAPALFDEIDSVRSALAVPPLQAVFIDPEINAGVTQVPRALGLLGTDRYLILGLPLMAALERDAFRAVLAHEFGHLSGNHSAFSAWIYRIRLSWQRIAERADDGGSKLEGWMARFIDWYVPYYLAYTFVLARQNEYEADAASAEVAGATAAATALVGVNVAAAQAAERYWPALFGRIASEPEPPRDPLTVLARAAREVAPPDVARFTATALERRTTVDDTHPSVADRLRALGVAAPDWRPPREPASALLGASEPVLLAEFDAGWHRSAAERWRARHREIQLEREELATLEAEPPAALEPAALLRRAELTEQLKDAAAAVPLYAALVEREPDHAVARFRLGRSLLERDDPAGLEHLRHACDLDHDAIEPACRIAYAWADARGRKDDAADFEARFDADQEQQRQAREERQGLAERDALEPHGLPPETAARIVADVARLDWVKSVYLARKRVRVFPNRPLFVVGVVSRTFSFAPAEKAQAVLAALPADLPLLVLDLDQMAWARKKLEKVEGARQA